MIKTHRWFDRMIPAIQRTTILIGALSCCCPVFAGEMRVFGLNGTADLYVNADDEDVQKIQEAAAEGDADAMHTLATMYATGKGVTKDTDEAWKWHRAAADTGNTDSMVELGWQKQNLSPPDYAGAAEWYRRASEQESSLARVFLIDLSMEGHLKPPLTEEVMHQWAHQAALDEIPAGQYMWGAFLFQQDNAEAAKWIEAGATNGHPGAMFAIGIMRELGKLIEQDTAEAARWYRLAVLRGSRDALPRLQQLAESGEVDAMFHFGFVNDNDYYHRTGLSDERAVHWYRQAAERGHLEAMYELAEHTNLGHGIEENQTDAHCWYMSAAEQGHLESMFSLGYRYREGHGALLDKKEAARWYRIAADQGHVWSMMLLASLYHDGHLDVENEDVIALEWLQKAAATEHKTAMNRIALIYAEGGAGVPQDWAEARKWYFMAVEAGDNYFAPYDIGLIYTNGWGVAVDHEEAARWYHKAAAASRVKAMCQLGLIYTKGQGVAKDEAEADRWYRMAFEGYREVAENEGHAGTMYELGNMYAEGLGVAKDPEEAMRWYEMAAAKGHKDAKRAIEGK